MRMMESRGVVIACRSPPHELGALSPAAATPQRPTRAITESPRIVTLLDLSRDHDRFLVDRDPRTEHLDRVAFDQRDPLLGKVGRRSDVDFDRLLFGLYGQVNPAE